MSPDGLPDLQSAGALRTRIVSALDAGATTEAAARLARDAHAGCVAVTGTVLRSVRGPAGQASHGR